jgi:hypothetical protein
MPAAAMRMPEPSAVRRDVRGHRAERDADPELAHALAHRERRHSEDATAASVRERSETNRVV